MAGRVLLFTALSVFFTAMVPFGFSSASGVVPLPLRKPIETQAKSNQDNRTKDFKVVKYSLTDIKKALKNVDIPFPTFKPVNVDHEGALSSRDADLYAKIFRLQANGKMDEAQKLKDRIRNDVILGHVLYQRYMHPTAYYSSFNELKTWLENYADHPGAQRIYDLAQKKRGNNKATLKNPTAGRGIPQKRDPFFTSAERYKSPLQRSAKVKNQIKAFDKSIDRMIRRRPQEALEKLNNEGRDLLDDVEYDTYLARIAESKLYDGNITEAKQLAKYASKRSGPFVPLSNWVLGLSQWIVGETDDAAKSFESAYYSTYASNWERSAAAYWAARSYEKMGYRSKTKDWLRAAVTHKRTFYSLLARQALQDKFDFNWTELTFEPKHHDILMEHPAAKRAMALVTAGQNHLAEEELVKLSVFGNEAAEEAVLAYAMENGLSALAMRLGHIVQDSRGRYYDAALYPVAHWAQFGEADNVDNALIHAIMRQESRFDVSAKSHAGARGLMQLMPETARMVAAAHNIRKNSTHALFEPKLNVQIGQRYVSDLLDNPLVKRDMVSLLIAYNAGPGNLLKWRRRWPDVKDPLLFLELIPIRETRGYVEKVLANYWIYRMRFGQEVPTLLALAKGYPAIYPVLAGSMDQPFEIASTR